MTVDEIKKRIIPILRQHGIKRAGIFGSAATGEDKKDSDIDILVEIQSDLSLLDFVGIKLELEETLGRNIDLVEYDTIKPAIREQILAQEVPVL